MIFTHCALYPIKIFNFSEISGVTTPKPPLDTPLVTSSKAGFTLECEGNANAAFENDVNVRYRRVTEVMQTAFSYVMNVQGADECNPSTVGMSKRIRI